MGDTTMDIEVNGFTFHVNIEHDIDSEAPWRSSDGHGGVRSCHVWHRSKYQGTKKPGERPMNMPSNGALQFYYDWQGACKEARKEGWNAEPYDAPNRVQRAVQADFDYLRGWVNKDWEYVHVHVTLANAPDYANCVGGVETFKDYHLEFAEELAQEVLVEYLDDLQKNKLKGVTYDVRKRRRL